MYVRVVRFTDVSADRIETVLRWFTGRRWAGRGIWLTAAFGDSRVRGIKTFGLALGSEQASSFLALRPSMPSSTHAGPA